VSSVPRNSEEELRQQWAFLDALVDRQASSLKSGSQDPEEDDLLIAPAQADALYKDEISVLTQRVTTLEGERTALLRRIDLAEDARIAAEAARAAAETARAAAEHALAAARMRPPAAPPSPVDTATAVQLPPVVAPRSTAPTPLLAPASRRRSWWQRFRD
jgi:septal ring factor EnvC (AmiA/AmiB activator)